MSQNLKLKVDGLYTNPNQFSEIPSGSLSKANNAVIDKGGVIEIILLILFTVTEIN